MAPNAGETCAKNWLMTMSEPWRSAATRSSRLGRSGFSPCAARWAFTRQRTAWPTVAAGAWPAATVVAAQGGDAAWVGGANSSAAITARGVAMTAVMGRRGGTGLVIGPAIGAEMWRLYPPCTQVDGRRRLCVERLYASAEWRPFDTVSSAGRH